MKAMTVKEKTLYEQLFKGCYIKESRHKFYLVSSEEPEINILEVPETLVHQMPLDLIEEKSRSRLYCLDISSVSRELDHGRTT